MSGGYYAQGGAQVFAGRYQLVQKIGEGGFGVVYKAVQLTTRQSVAIKVLQLDKAQGADQSEVERFQREMEVIGRLNHPNIVRLVDAGQTDQGELFTVLEFIDGEELKDYVARRGGLPIGEALHLMTEVLDALGCAHNAGIVHRDLKPANIMITHAGVRPNAMVLDFGIAGIAEDARDASYKALTAAGKIHGTPAYMAPEQIMKTGLAGQTDLYAWGLMFLECVTGQQAAPISGNLTEVISWQISPDPIPLPPQLQNHPIGPVIAQALARDIQHRPDAQSLYNAIAQVQQSGLSGEGAPGPGAPRRPQPANNPGATLHDQRTRSMSVPTPPRPDASNDPDGLPWKLIAIGALLMVGLLTILFIGALLFS